MRGMRDSRRAADKVITVTEVDEGGVSGEMGTKAPGYAEIDAACVKMMGLTLGSRVDVAL
jgi:hypothetical protein